MKAALVLAALCSSAAAAYCPSYTLSSSANSHNCGVEAAPGTNPTPAQWQAIFALVANGPSAWGSSGPSVANIGAGCGKPLPSVQVPAKFPCELLKAIAMQESGWKQFCAPTTPSDQVGKSSRTIISFDCGYGIGQVTSGMHIGESPAFDRSRVVGDPTYNLATGTQILAAKWRATQCVGDNQPTIVEHWYTATWAYNGLAYSNNPSNPAFSSTRGIWNPQVGGSAPYQEKVFGWMERPPSPSHWTSTAVAYPDPALVGSSGSPPALPNPSCATPTNCNATRPTHVSSCVPAPDAGVADAGTTADAGQADAGVADAGVADAGSARDAGGAADAGGGQAPDAGGALALIKLPALQDESLGGEALGGCASAGGAPGLGVVLLLLVAARRRGTPLGR